MQTDNSSLIGKRVLILIFFMVLDFIVAIWSLQTEGGINLVLRVIAIAAIAEIVFPLEERREWGRWTKPFIIIIAVAFLIAQPFATWFFEHGELIPSDEFLRNYIGRLFNIAIVTFAVMGTYISWKKVDVLLEQNKDLEENNAAE